jgi:hypothetical protein
MQSQGIIYPAETVEYVAKKGRNGGDRVMNVCATIVRWLQYNVSESPQYRFHAPFIAFVDPDYLEHSLWTILDNTTGAWDFGENVPFSIVFLQDNVVLLKIARVRVQITVAPEATYKPPEITWYVEDPPKKVSIVVSKR